MSKNPIPTEPGFYWVRLTSATPWRICEVRWYKNSCDLWAIVYSTRHAVVQEIHDDFFGYWWGGAIRPPDNKF